MDEIDILKKAGLSETQASVYYCLFKNGTMTPTELAKNTGQSRENCYMIAKKFLELNLIEQTNDKKSTYRAPDPANLEILAEKRRKVIAKNSLNLCVTPGFNARGFLTLVPFAVQLISLIATFKLFNIPASHFG